MLLVRMIGPGSGLRRSSYADDPKRTSHCLEEYMPFGDVHPELCCYGFQRQRAACSRSLSRYGQRSPRIGVGFTSNFAKQA